MKRASRESGQAAVETAIVMPLFLFVMLGIVQLGLAHQARLITRYAAYKATRAGALQRAKKDIMTNAALGVLVPITADANSGLVHKAGSAGAYAASWGEAKKNDQDGLPIVETTICNPLSKDLKETDDFDDPIVASGKDGDWKGFQRSRLHVQTTFYYRLMIPFVDGILFYSTAGLENQHQEIFSTLRLRSRSSDDTKKDRWTDAKRARAQIAKILSLAEKKKYYLPIRANYAMRLQSNVAKGELPASNQCFINFKKKSGSGSAEIRKIENHSKSGTSQ